MPIAFQREHPPSSLASLLFSETTFFLSDCSASWFLCLLSPTSVRALVRGQPLPWHALLPWWAIHSKQGTVQGWSLHVVKISHGWLWLTWFFLGFTVPYTWPSFTSSHLWGRSSPIAESDVRACTVQLGPIWLVFYEQCYGLRVNTEWEIHNLTVTRGPALTDLNIMEWGLRRGGRNHNWWLSWPVQLDLVMKPIMLCAEFKLFFFRLISLINIKFASYVDKFDTLSIHGRQRMKFVWRSRTNMLSDINSKLYNIVKTIQNYKH